MYVSFFNRYLTMIDGFETMQVVPGLSRGDAHRLLSSLIVDGTSVGVISHTIPKSWRGPVGMRYDLRPQYNGVDV